MADTIHEPEVSTTNLRVLPRARPRLSPPPGVSKSIAKVMQCPHYFTGQYLQPERIGHALEHFLTRSGVELHQWRRAYAHHLLETGKDADPEFRVDYLDRHQLSEDGRSLIEKDECALDADNVYAPELFLSVDKDFRPLDHRIVEDTKSPQPSPGALAWGTIDLLLLEGRTATARDPKSGYSTVNVTDDEPIIYAALILAHFPQVEEVNWIWDFVRKHMVRTASYQREVDFGWMQDHVRELARRKDEMVAAYNAGETMEANPFSGLCPYCQLRCPLRPRFEAGELSLAMPQTREDAIQLARVVKVCEDLIDRGRELVKAWLDQDETEVLPLGNGWQAEARAYETSEYPLTQALAQLGLALISLDGLSPEERAQLLRAAPEKSPAYDVPLSSLTLGNLTSFAKAKKRAGLKEDLRTIAKRSASTRLTIRKPAPDADTQDLVPLLEESIEMKLEEK